MPLFPEVQVDPYIPLHDDNWAAQIPTVTKLFRKESYIGEVLDIAFMQREAKSTDPFHVLSVGSSYGPEVDSALAYATTVAADIGKMTVTGVDINSDVVTRARQGIYKVSYLYNPDEKVLRRGLPMFQITPLEEQGYQRTHTSYLIDSNELRAPHDVTFLHGDMTSDNLGIPKADVIFCNNVLYHHNRDTAERIVARMTSQLKLKGIMSFGYNTHHLEMGRGRRQYNHANWRRTLGPVLEAQGIKSIMYDDQKPKAPFAFLRIA